MDASHITATSTENRVFVFDEKDCRWDRRAVMVADSHAVVVSAGRSFIPY